MKLLLKILFIIFIVWMCVGTYFIQTEHPKAQIIMGLGVFYLSFLLMPVFIYYRYRDGKYKKYIINDEKLKEAFKEKK
jgi:flagellar biosynthesis protein FliP